MKILFACRETLSSVVAYSTYKPPRRACTECPRHLLRVRRASGRRQKRSGWHARCCLLMQRCALPSHGPSIKQIAHGSDHRTWRHMVKQHHSVSIWHGFPIDQFNCKVEKTVPGRSSQKTSNDIPHQIGATNKSPRHACENRHSHDILNHGNAHNTQITTAKPPETDQTKCIDDPTREPLKSSDASPHDETIVLPIAHV